MRVSWQESAIKDTEIKHGIRRCFHERFGEKWEREKDTELPGDPDLAGCGKQSNHKVKWPFPEE